MFCHIQCYYVLEIIFCNERMLFSLNSCNRLLLLRNLITLPTCFGRYLSKCNFRACCFVVGLVWFWGDGFYKSNFLSLFTLSCDWYNRSTGVNWWHTDSLCVASTSQFSSSWEHLNVEIATYTKTESQLASISPMKTTH